MGLRKIPSSSLCIEETVGHGKNPCSTLYICSGTQNNLVLFPLHRPQYFKEKFRGPHLMEAILSSSLNISFRTCKNSESSSYREAVGRKNSKLFPYVGCGRSTELSQVVEPRKILSSPSPPFLYNMPYLQAMGEALSKGRCELSQAAELGRVRLIGALPQQRGPETWKKSELNA